MMESENETPAEKTDTSAGSNNSSDVESTDSSPKKDKKLRLTGLDAGNRQRIKQILKKTIENGWAAAVASPTTKKPPVAPKPKVKPPIAPKPKSFKKKIPAKKNIENIATQNEETMRREVMSPVRDNITTGNVKRLEQLFSAMANRSPTKEEIRSAPNVRRREMISPEQRGDARRLSSKVAFAAQAKLGQELGRDFSGDEGSSGQDHGGENIEEVLTGKLGIREAVHAFDVLVSEPFVPFLASGEKIGDELNDTGELMRSAIFLQREFLRIAPQVTMDHPEAKRVLKENQDILIYCRNLCDQVSEKSNVKPHIEAIRNIVEALSWTSLGRYSSDDETCVHVKKFCSDGLVELAKISVRHQGNSLHDSWCSSYKKLTEGITSVVERYHHPRVNWSSAYPTPDIDVRPYTPLLESLDDALKDKFCNYRDAFDQALRQYTSSRGNLLASSSSSNGSIAAEPQDVTPVRKLGNGSFGNVVLVYDKNGTKSACKIMSKAPLVKSLEFEHILNERTIVSCVSCPFIVGFHGCFQDSMNLYLNLELITGGELLQVLQKQPFGRLPSDAARFIVAETTIALEYLQNLDICFRDLKPENILLDEDGHVRLTDFGLSRRMRPGRKCWTMCGTPEYMAPEIVLSKGHTCLVDWWALGVLTYELRIGITPFSSKTEFDTYNYIISKEVEFPDTPELTSEEQDFIRQLLTKDPADRLGHKKLARLHDYFKPLSFVDLLNRSIKPPFWPEPTEIEITAGTSTIDEWAKDVGKAAKKMDQTLADAIFATF
eukprot:m.320278 g.320278  ORF g.320278 m.320278 type:complete len:775 (-) comp16518_c0_seq1:207-2531(-)